ncbi:3-phosphoshikimate 1-carboxyvinyltransferase [Rhabdothermincola salaria]|uniref:3-phosphoshikimate 1-carboxyvinyltransferase n=1 Tax=Rhabdothermincola salaria TaxID=2903142 RepID=UPI001E504994|nr:3-phosphoshikimate 1-carboxyvinyltransferase [Rhabdothermincola salaria]MCD9623124.1 3-phosphoshikimate 1-carboxyvinyltransferase [Rhabdothermincola salaria]
MTAAASPPGAPLPDPYEVLPFAGPVDAVVRPPGSKSITNRALVAAALAPGRSVLTGVLFADDTEAMLDCIARLGAHVRIDRPTLTVTVDGVGGRIADGPVDLDARLSGTTSRFVLPMLTLGAGPYRLDGAEALRARPMGPVLDALRAMGAEVVEEGRPGHLPVTVRGTGGPPASGASSLGGGGATSAPIPPAQVLDLPGDVSSQFVSGLLLSAPCGPPGTMTVRLTTTPVSVPYLDMTVAVMRSFGVPVERPDARTFVIHRPGPSSPDDRSEPWGYRAAASYTVEPDASAASYFFAAAAITGGRVRVEGLDPDSLQGDVAFVDVLERMGATVVRERDGIEVRGTGTLRGVEADFADISDTAQTLAAVAVFADSPTRVRGIGFIRGKETDRIAAVVSELRRCGIDASEHDDGFSIRPGAPRAAVVQTYDDHRMAMSFALLGLRAAGVAIADPGCVAKTFPDYFSVLESLRPPPGDDRPHAGSDR